LGTVLVTVYLSFDSEFREGWREHLWQERFASFIMDETHCLVAARYIELNPVRAGLAETPEGYAWSSAQAHLRGEDDGLVKAALLLAMAGDRCGLLQAWPTEEEVDAIRKHGRTGRPLGTLAFVARIEDLLRRPLRRGKTGPKPGAGRRREQGEGVK
jgi:putative transposase